MPDGVYKRLRHKPESWTVEVHIVEVYVGTDGDHQDEFVRVNRLKDRDCEKKSVNKILL